MLIFARRHARVAQRAMRRSTIMIDTAAPTDTDMLTLAIATMFKARTSSRYARRTSHYGAFRPPGHRLPARHIIIYHAMIIYPSPVAFPHAGICTYAIHAIY